MSNLPTQYQEYIHLSRYSRWLPEEGRRETWTETVGRYYDFFEEGVKAEKDMKKKKKEDAKKANERLEKMLTEQEK